MSPRGPGPRQRRWWRVLTPAALSVVAWLAWLGWDHSYYYDADVGAYQGPYRAWQVVGCVLTLLVASLVGGVLLRPALAALTVMLPFTVAWTVAAAVQDESGLFGVGALLIAVGLYVGALLFSSIAHVAWKASRAG